MLFSMSTSSALQVAWSNIPLPAIVAVIGYLFLVRTLRYGRKKAMEAPFTSGGRSLSSMTVEEAQNIMNQLQELEFPRSMAKARQISLLKAGAIPTMSKLFVATGQNTRRNAGRRAVDTEILLREAQSKPRDSDRYATAVARMNYLHDRYRRANKITNNDLLHTLGDSLISIFEVVDKDEWRKLTDVERCAAGVFHKILGEDMKIPYDVLPSHSEGWRDGLHFANELTEWVVQYENEVARPSEATNHYVSVYVDAAVSTLPDFVRITLRKTLAADMNDIMVKSLNLESPGPILSAALLVCRNLRKLYLQHLSLPRTTSSAVRLVDDDANPQSKLYNFQRKVLQPWYMKPTFWSTWGPAALLLRSLGAKAPGSQGDRYYPQGYDLMTIGPEPQKGKGIEEMTSDIEIIKGRGVATCPFSQAKAGYI